MYENFAPVGVSSLTGSFNRSDTLVAWDAAVQPAAADVCVAQGAIATVDVELGHTDAGVYTVPNATGVLLAAAEPFPPVHASRYTV